MSNLSETGKSVWEILIPVSDNDGNRFENENFDTWEKRLLAIAGGFTLALNVTSMWRDKDGNIYTDISIPYRVMCEYEEAKRLADFARVEFRQKAVMITCISTFAVIIEEFAVIIEEPDDGA